jgi:hypothetical protein
VEGALFVAAQPGVVVGGDQHHVVPTVMGDNHRLAPSGRPEAPELSRELASGHFVQD